MQEEQKRAFSRLQCCLCQAFGLVFMLAGACLVVAGVIIMLRIKDDTLECGNAEGSLDCMGVSTELR